MAHLAIVSIHFSSGRQGPHPPPIQEYSVLVLLKSSAPGEPENTNGGFGGNRLFFSAKCWGGYDPS